jgi:hypothetical protein
MVKGKKPGAGPGPGALTGPGTGTDDGSRGTGAAAQPAQHLGDPEEQRACPMVLLIGDRSTNAQDIQLRRCLGRASSCNLVRPLLVRFRGLPRAFSDVEENARAGRIELISGHLARRERGRDHEVLASHSIDLEPLVIEEHQARARSRGRSSRPRVPAPSTHRSRSRTRLSEVPSHGNNPSTASLRQCRRTDPGSIGGTCRHRLHCSGEAPWAAAGPRRLAALGAGRAQSGPSSGSPCESVRARSPLGMPGRPSADTAGYTLPAGGPGNQPAWAGCWSEPSPGIAQRKASYPPAGSPRRSPLFRPWQVIRKSHSSTLGASEESNHNDPLLSNKKSA